METSKITSEHEHPSLALANILFATWLYSLLWGGGIFFAAMAFLGAIVAGLISFFESPIWNVTMIIVLILGLAATFFSPILLWATITHNWPKNTKTGLGSFLASMLTFLAIWISSGVFYQWTSDHTYFFYALLISLPASSAILTSILLTRLNQHRAFELLTGVSIGIGLSTISAMLGENLLKGDNNMFHLTWQIPSLVWVSVVYFAELLAGRSKWTDFLVWAFLTLISFGLPYIVVFLLSVD